MPLLRVLTSCPGREELRPGQEVQATAEEAQRWLAEGCVELVRERRMERADRWV